ncbi:MAG: AMP-binding protein [Oscillospiraceae bacterium]|nr:AMP-binding protein [Oscillospiraceae bacterium]
MRLSFSTRGWGDMSWQELCDTADEMGFGGIELYNIFKYPALTDRGGPLHPYSVGATVRALRERKLSIPCLDSSYDLSDGDDATQAGLQGLIRLAAELRCPYVSAYAAHNDIETITAALRGLATLAEDEGVTLLIKTSGVFADTGRLRALLDEFACDGLGVLWDVHHPYRDYGESAAQTITNLGAYVKHVHLRDSSGKFVYELIGEGNFPVAEVMRALYSVDYAGFISLEWKPDWLPELPDSGVIFPHFVNYMGRFENTRGKKRMLYPNHDGSGEYVWKHDELINLTFPQVLDRMAEEFPDQYCFKYTTLDYTRTYAQFREDVDTFARALVGLGVKPGYKVTVWCTNVPAWYITFWACCRIGAVLVTMNTAYKIHEAEYLLRQSDTHTLVMIRGALDSDYAAIINELCPEIASARAGEPLHCKRLPFLRNVITADFRQKGCLSFDEAMARASMVPPEETARLAAAVRPDDVCNMQYTSGTTGFPKGVMLTHYNIVNDGKMIGDGMDLSTADRMMIQVPMFHCFGMVLAMTASMTHGVTMSPIPAFSPKKGLDCINREKITAFHGVPTMFIAMLGHEDFPKTDFSHMRTGIMAGSPCPIEKMREVVEKMHMRDICITYGQTEASPATTMSKTTDSIETRVNTVGGPIFGVECKIVDPETGEDCPDNVDGEFCARGYNIMKGYYKMPEATAAVIDKDGWLHSGDLLRRLPDGNYKVTGRIKDMIIRGGENIYPKEIEEFIYTHPKVSDVQVIGVPDKAYGEEIMACVIPKPGEECTAEEIQTYVRDHMAKHKVPRYVVFVDSFPMNAAGKILKYKMREAAVEKLGLKS